MPPETRTEATLFVALSRLRGRLRLRHLLQTLALSCIVAALVTLALRGLTPTRRGFALGAPVRTQVAGLLALLAASAWWWWRRPARSLDAAADAWECADAGLKNLAVTALQIARSGLARADAMQHRIDAGVADHAARLHPARAVPLVRDGTVLLAAIAFLGLTTVPSSLRSSRTPGSAVASGTAIAMPPPAALDVIIHLSPPPYTGRPERSMKNPATIDAIAGSHARIELEGEGRSATVRVNGARVTTAVPLLESGSIAVDAGEQHRVIPLTVVPDRAPDVHVTAPGRDLRVSDLSRAIPIDARADDDFGLREMEIRYTVISGSGENFTFAEGVLPAAISRDSDVAWRAHATLTLSRLKLGPGDSLVYRATAADQRPGAAGVGSSDTYFVQIAGPGDVPLDAVDMPPDRERYALSEQMIVLKIERLRTREHGLTRQAVEEEAGAIEAEQRAVRANFIFMLGGEVQDEDVEAQESTDIQEGRFANRARQDVAAATVLMGRVQTALGAVATGEALARAREAVIALQRAFGHSRYLLRALPSREKIDPSRRLSGDLAGASDWTLVQTLPASEPTVAAARSAMRDLLSIAAELEAQPREAAEALPRVAERVLTIDPGNASLAHAGRAILDARAALTAGRIATAREQLAAAVRLVQTRADDGRLDTAPGPAGPSRLAGLTAVEKRR